MLERYIVKAYFASLLSKTFLINIAQLMPYRILSFILLPIAALMGIVTLIALLAALVNPPLLLGVFLLSSVVIYVISSFIFLQKGIDNKQMCRHSLRDWIRVNAFVTIVFCALAFLNTATLLTNPKLFMEAVTQGLARQNQALLPEATLIKVMKGVLYFLLAFAGILLVHIVLTFRILKTYRHMFKPKE